MENNNCQNWLDVMYDIHGKVYETPVLVEVKSIKDEEISKVRDNDQLLINEVSVEEIKLYVSPYDNGAFSDYRLDDYIKLPPDFPGKLRACPQYSAEHVFKSCKQVLDVFPFIGDFIFPNSALTVDGVKIGEYQHLQVIKKISNVAFEGLEVLNLRNKRTVVIPSNCLVEFMQVKTDTIKQSISPSKREYSILELLQYQTSEITPMKVQLIIEENDGNEKEESKSEKRIRKKLYNKLLKSKPESKPAIVEKRPIDSSYNVFPRKWWHKVLLLEPILIANVTNPADPMKSFDLEEDLNMQVTVQSLHENDDTETKLETKTSNIDRHRPSIPVRKLSIEDYFEKDKTNNAIVAVVMSDSERSATRQQGFLAFGHLIALHGIRKIHKLLVESDDGSNFLVSTCYQGNISPLPNLFEKAGDVLTDVNVTYLTQTTSHPVLKQFDSCHKGEYVQFLKKSNLRISETRTVQVVHCLVSKTFGGAQKTAMYPMNIRGRFLQILEGRNTCQQVKDIFKMNLPFSFCVDAPDPTLGYDPMLKKTKIVAKQLITETTIVVEMVSKVNDVIKGVDMFLELPMNRGSLLLRNLPTKYSTDDEGVKPYPIKDLQSGFQRLPCVEMLSNFDVNDLKNAEKKQLNSPQSEEGVSIYKQQFNQTTEASTNISNYEQNTRETEEEAAIYTVMENYRKELRHKQIRHRSSYDDIIPSQRFSKIEKLPCDYAVAGKQYQNTPSFNNKNINEDSSDTRRRSSIFEGPCTEVKRTVSNGSQASSCSCDSNGNRPIPKPRTKRTESNVSSLAIVEKRENVIQRISSISDEHTSNINLSDEEIGSE